MEQEEGDWGSIIMIFPLKNYLRLLLYSEWQIFNHQELGLRVYDLPGYGYLNCSPFDLIMSLKLVSQLRKKNIPLYKNVVKLKTLNLTISNFLASMILVPLRITHKKYFFAPCYKCSKCHGTIYSSIFGSVNELSQRKWLQWIKINQVKCLFWVKWTIIGYSLNKFVRSLIVHIN